MLRQTFLEVCSANHIDAATAEGLWSEIEKAYSANDRHYHNLAHLQSMLTHLISCQSQIQDWDATILALVYHDIVYNSLSSDNEKRSAEIATARLRPHISSEKKIATISRMIEATKGHAKTEDKDINIFLDADLSILGAGSADYIKYVAAVRREYKLFPDLIYKPGRRKVLQNFLKMPQIYKTDAFFRLEDAAKKNISEELKTL